MKKVRLVIRFLRALASRVLKKYSIYTLKTFFIYFNTPFHNSPNIPFLIFHITPNTIHLFIHFSLSLSSSQSANPHKPQKPNHPPPLPATTSHKNHCHHHHIQNPQPTKTEPSTPTTSHRPTKTTLHHHTQNPQPTKQSTKTPPHSHNQPLSSPATKTTATTTTRKTTIQQPPNPVCQREVRSEWERVQKKREKNKRDATVNYRVYWYVKVYYSWWVKFLEFENLDVGCFLLFWSLKWHFGSSKTPNANCLLSMRIKSLAHQG